MSVKVIAMERRALAMHTPTAHTRAGHTCMQRAITVSPQDSPNSHETHDYCQFAR